MYGYESTHGPILDIFYSGRVLPRRPSPFLQDTIARYEKYFCEWIEALEQLLLSDANKNSSGIDSLQSLPNILSNVHDFFVHVAAKVESLHQCIESMKTAYLTDHQHRGDGNDPFLEANRRETAKQEAAAARRIHPMLHLPAITQPSTQVAGLFASSACGSSLFGSFSASPESSLLGSASEFSFGSSPTPLFGTGASTFGSTTPAGCSLFGTPSFASGPSDAPLPPTAFKAFVKVPSFLRPHTQIYCTM